MAVYSISIIQSGNIASSLRFVRDYSEQSLSELKSAIEDGLEVVQFDSESHSLDLGSCEGAEHQHLRFNGLVELLDANGDQLAFHFRPAPGDVPEDASLDMIHNLMYSEVQSKLR